VSPLEREPVARSDATAVALGYKVRFVSKQTTKVGPTSGSPERVIEPLGIAISQSELLQLEAIAGFWANYLIPTFIVGYTIWWAYTLRRGSKIHRSTLALHIAVYGLAAVYIYEISFYELYSQGVRTEVVGVVWMLLALAIAYTAVRIGILFGTRLLQVVQTESGHWQLRGPFEIAIFWGVLYSIRYLMEYFLLQGYSVFFPIHPLSGSVTGQTFSAVVVTVASLYLVSFGFLLGVSIAEWLIHGEMLEYAEAAAPSSSTGSASSP
jgi:hypothetical protein